MTNKNEIEKTFLELLREKNIERCEKFFGHAVNEWNNEKWMLALIGEFGELANLFKKQIRGDVVGHIDEKIKNEIADIFIYLDLLCANNNIDIANIVMSKFNVVSRERLENCNILFSELEYVRFSSVKTFPYKVGMIEDIMSHSLPEKTLEGIDGITPLDENMIRV